jgi:molybdate transport system permease protein
MIDWTVIRTTVLLATLSACISLVIAAPLAWRLSRSRSMATRLIGAVVSLPLVLPPTVLGFYLLIAMGPRGPLGPLLDNLGIHTLAFSFPGIVIGSVIHSLPFVLQPVQSSFAALGDRPLEAAATLGASPIDRFFTVALPLAAPGFVNAAILGFMHSLGEFGVVLMIGGNIPGKTRVMSTALFEYVESMQYSRAHALAGIILFIAGVALFIVRSINPRAL